MTRYSYLSSLAATAAVVTLPTLATAAGTTLQPNDVQIVAFASDAPDAMAFVTWVDLLPGTEIRFTDRGWACGGFQASGESELIFTAAETIAAGSVFAYEDDMDTAGTPWSLASGSFSLTGDPGDQLIVYQGTLADPTPIFAFDSTGGWEANCTLVTDSYGSVVPDGLVDGVSAVSMDHSDSFWYRPWYSKSATLPTLKEWMVNRDRFKTTSTSATRVAEYQPPTEGFTILTGQRGANGYTEYIPGTAPCIILSGHDGDLYPSSIDDRTHGCYDAVSETCDWSKTCSPQDDTNCKAKTGNDENTMDMARRANDHFRNATGMACHLIVNRLARVKLDPNREVEQAAQFDATALQAYNEFHAFASQARAEIENNHPCGKGVLIDFHGHVHPEARIEMGYKLSSDQLREVDAVLDGLAYTSSIKNMPSHTNADFSQCIRGTSSMGALFELPTAQNASGYESVPSPKVNAPAEGEDYFQGGYNIETHGSENGGSIDGIQIEFPRYLRAEEFGQQADMLEAFGHVVVPQMLQEHYLWVESSNACVECTEHAHCEDNNGCTINTCHGDGHCVSESACLAGEVCLESTNQCVVATDWVSIFTNSFETGWEDFNDGGGDATRRTDYAHSGTYSIRIRDNSGGDSSMYTDFHDVAQFQTLRFDFWYYPDSMETGEDFLLEYSTDDGASWTTVASWVRGTDFENGSWYEVSQEFDASGINDDVRFRLRCDASSNADKIYIDDVEFLGKM